MTPEEINAAIQKSVTEALRPITAQLATFGESIKPIAELQTQVKGLVEADSARTIAGKETAGAKGKTDPAAAATLTAEAVSKLVSEGIAAALKSRDETSAASAAQQAAHEAWLRKHAGRLADNPLGRRLFAGAKTDEERQAILNEYIEGQKALGIKPPDLGASAAGEGGAAPAAGGAEAKKAAALEAAKNLRPVTI